MPLMKKNVLLLLLMASSMILLLALEGLWLQQNYKKQQWQLDETLDRLFMESIFDQQDSLINRLILQPIMEQLPDSVKGIDLYPNLRWRDKDKKERTYYPKRDSFSIPRPQDTMDRVEFKVVDSRDWDWSRDVKRRIIRSLAYTLKGLDKENFDFISFGEDSLRLTNIEHTFQRKLDAAGMHLAFTVFRRERGEEITSDQGMLTRPARGDIPFRSTYQAHIINPQPYLLRKQLPSLFFSFMLTLLTAAAFVLTYRSLKRQQKLTEMKNQFISNVTHELQTPITSVGVALEAISNFDVIKDQKKTEEYLEMSKSELNRLSMLVDKVLKMALFEEQSLQFNWEVFDLNLLVKDVLKTLQLQFEQAGAEVELETSGSQFMIRADRVHTTSVIYNLMDNALKYNDTPVRIHLSVKESGTHILFSIADNGIGIPDRYQQKVFEKFFRVPSGNLHKVKGHGLGLSYVATIIEKMGARLRLRSKEAEGSTFSLEFPKTKPSLS